MSDPTEPCRLHQAVFVQLRLEHPPPEHDPEPPELAAQLLERQTRHRGSVRDLVLWGRRRWPGLTRVRVIEILGDQAQHAQRRVPTPAQWETLYQMRQTHNTPWHRIRHYAHREWGLYIKRETLIAKMAWMWDKKHEKA